MANPAVGYATDFLVRAGATMMFSETTEVRDGIDQLTARAINADVANGMIREMAWYDDYLKKAVSIAAARRLGPNTGSCTTH